MMNHPLFDALIQAATPLPSHVRPAGVGMPKPLPKLLRYGPTPPPQAGGSQFTGGRVAQPQASMVHPMAAQGFTPPAFTPPNATAPSLAPFIQTQQGGLPTGPPFNVAGAQTGATSQPPMMLPPRPAPPPGAFAHPFGGVPGPQAPSPTDQVAASTNPPTQGGINTGGYTNTAQILATLLGIKPNPSTFTGGNVRYYV